MAPTRREVVEGKQAQGTGETTVWSITTTPWGGSPSGPSAVAYNVTDGARTDVSASVLSSSPTVAGDVITSPCLTALCALQLYRVEVAFYSGCTLLETFFNVEGEN